MIIKLQDGRVLNATGDFVIDYQKLGERWIVTLGPVHSETYSRILGSYKEEIHAKLIIDRIFNEFAAGEISYEMPNYNNEGGIVI